MDTDTDLLRESFLRIMPRKEEFAVTFYRTLLEKYPYLHRFFVGVDLRRQQTSLLATLLAMLNEAEHGEELRAIFYKLGRRHNALQIRADQYPAFGQTLLETLAVYDPQWTDALHIAWAAALEHCVRFMMEAYSPDATIYRVQISGVRSRKIAQ